MIDEGNSELEVVKVIEEDAGYSKELEEEEEGRSLSTFSDKDVESKDLASLEKTGPTESGEEGYASVKVAENSVPSPNSNSNGHPTGDVSEDEETSYESNKKLISSKVKDLSIGSRTEEGLPAGEAATEEGEEPGETAETTANDSVSGGTDQQGIKGIPRIPRRRSRSPSLEEGQSVEELSKISGSFSPNNSGTTDSSHKKRRKRASSGWDAQNNNSSSSPTLAPIPGNSGSLHGHLSGAPGAVPVNTGVATNSNPSLNVGSGVGPSAAGTATAAGAAAAGAGASGGSSSGPRQSSQISRIYVGSLDYSLNEADIKQVFGSFGSIINIDMPREGNRSKGFCFVEYTSQESAEMALATMNRFVLKGRPIRVGRPTNAATSNSNQSGGASGNAINPNIAVYNNNQIAHQSHPAQPDTSHGAGTAAPSQNRIYIGSVPYSFTTDDLRHIFKAFGVILSCQLIPSIEKPGTHRGYGFIEFGTADQAKLAIETMNGFEVGGKQLKVNVATALKPQSSNSGGGAQSGVASANVSQMPMINTMQNMMPSQMPPMGIPHQMVLPSMMQMPNVAPPPPLPIYQQPPGYPLATGPAPYQIPGAISPVASSNIILLTNMVGPDEIDDELKEEVKIECSKYGKVYDVRIHISNNISKPSDRVRIFVVFESPSMAQIAVPALNNRWFGGNQVFCSLYNTERYYSSFLDD
ncbi:Ro ribonucleoprotein-binding protein 1 [Cryptosporidium canis]|uniref:Ro ribonucleoprotein-binding protein 1 n=1 Tax=Cryptosporidium canis TaxID=195482 RepID=A0ABQ8P338_9CRYT|nr:Ro ribonucleoprotein-binding protein 1 [Cryptosporidium canis]